MALKLLVIILTATSLALGQRPFFAGSRPIGYPEITTTTVKDDLGNRFGENDKVSTTTQRLPIEANGDKDLVDRLSKLPIDQQPFWFINWQAIEANRGKPQTYPLRPNQFAQPLAPPDSAQNNVRVGEIIQENPNTNVNEEDKQTNTDNFNLNNRNGGNSPVIKDTYVADSLNHPDSDEQKSTSGSSESGSFEHSGEPSSRMENSYEIFKQKHPIKMPGNVVNHFPGRQRIPDHHVVHLLYHNIPEPEVKNHDDYYADANPKRSDTTFY